MRCWRSTGWTSYTGNMLNTTMDEYKLPGWMEMPEMVSLIDDGDTREVVIGMAEPAAIPGASAIANAVFNACGVRVNSPAHHAGQNPGRAGSNAPEEMINHGEHGGHGERK